MRNVGHRRTCELLVVEAEFWRQAKQQRRHDISILGQWPHYMEKQSISRADLLDLPHCALGKTINVKQLCSSPGPRKWDSLLAIGIMAVHLLRGSEMLSILGTWSIVSRLDQERRGASTVPVWKIGPHSTASLSNLAFCLSSSRLTERHTARRCLIHTQSAVYVMNKEVAGDYKDTNTS